MDRFDTMKLFIRLVELRSFTKVADELGIPRSSVTIAIQQLEARLGTRLLHRTTRQVSTTLDGDAYFLRCQRLVADLEETEEAFASTPTRLRGKLRVDLQGTLATHFLLPYIGEFCEAHPQLELEIGMGDRLVDLVREGIDCVLRAGEPKDSSMVGRRVATLEQVTCASAGYIGKAGLPTTLDAFSRHRAINYATATGKVVPFDFQVEGQRRSVHLKSTVTVSNAEAYVLCCQADLGFIQLPRYHVEAQLKAGTLVEVLPEFHPAPMPVTLLYPQHRQLSHRVRAFVDWVAERMRLGSR
jgi:DNA-binding transcriptional LysR family regulator